MKSHSPQPRLSLHAHYRGQPLHLAHWRKLAKAALAPCLAQLKFPEAPLATLEEIEISLISDPAIADVHAQFLDDPTPTDVITFHHGEILISLDTAARQAQEHSHPYEREVALYLIHGLLHLAGWNDIDPEERRQMHQHQNRILDNLWSE
ncbi:rRNA maturation RNase YbeY [Phragmitibacter flavus]|uniref:rRNA maturation RNase YbeY n=1 Tax=Phragmitibacter flavus TaxID=2576071 RepID=UPI00140D88C7|nr:rRNA maturation RNase YbeY [Phragmitibacter flavus]